jgi:hypothetical protein
MIADRAAQRLITARCTNIPSAMKSHILSRKSGCIEGVGFNSGDWVNPPEFGGVGKLTVNIEGKDTPVYVLNDNDAIRFNDLRSIAHDLKLVIQCCRQFEISDRLENSEFTDALIDCALIRYRRCFNNGKRFTLPRDVVENLTDDQRQLHVYLIDLANKHVAHSVSDYEQFNTVVAAKQVVKGQVELGWFGPFDYIYGLMPEEVTRFGIIAQCILNDVVIPYKEVLWDRLIDKWSNVDENEFQKLKPPKIDLNKQKKIQIR